MQTDTVRIVDRGRGPQLSSSRITVQDLVPYLQQQYTHEQILAIMPVLTLEDLLAVERYVKEHHDEVMEQDRLIRERAAERKDNPAVKEILRRGEKMAALREEFRKKKQERER